MCGAGARGTARHPDGYAKTRIIDEPSLAGEAPARKAKKSKRWKNRECDRPSAGLRPSPRDMSLPSLIVTNSI
jgi:hypothetical protein